MSTSVHPDQFEISDEGINHKPTGYTFTPYPGNPFSGNVRIGQLGNVLKSGENYRPDQVKEMAEMLWIKHCENKNSSLSP